MHHVLNVPLCGVSQMPLMRPVLYVINSEITRMKPASIALKRGLGLTIRKGRTRTGARLVYVEE